MIFPDFISQEISSGKEMYIQNILGGKNNGYGKREDHLFRKTGTGTQDCQVQKGALQKDCDDLHPDHGAPERSDRPDGAEL